MFIQKVLEAINAQLTTVDVSHISANPATIKNLYEMTTREHTIEGCADLKFCGRPVYRSNDVKENEFIIG